MDFFKGIGDFFGNLFGGNKDDEEKKRREAQAQAQRPQPVNQPPQQFQNPAQQKLSAGFAMPQQPNNQIALPQLLQKAQPATPADTRSDQQKELDRLTQSELPRALDEEKNRTSWFDRTFTDREWNKRAENLARVRASTKYGELHGYGDQAQKDFSGETSRRSGDLVENSRRQLQYLNDVASGMQKVGQVAQYVPVTGSIINLGLAGADATNLGGLSKDYHETRNQLDFGMSTDQYNQLDEETKKKLEILRGAGLALAPLDFFGIGGLAKTGLVKAGKTAALEGITKGVVEEETKQALKKAALQTTKNLAIPTAAGTAVSAGGQAYLNNGQVDPLEAIKNGLLVGGTSQFFSGNLTKAAKNEVAEGVTSVNPTREADAAQAAEAQATKQIEAQAANENAALKEAGNTSPTKAAANAIPPVGVAENVDVTPPISEPTPAPTPAPVTNTIDSVVARADQELNAYKQANPTATPQQVSRAQAAINARLVAQIREMQQPAPVPPVSTVETPQPTPAAAVSPPPEPTRADAAAEAPTSGEAPAATATPPVEAPVTPPMPENAVDTAPRTHDALVKTVTDALGSDADKKGWLANLKNKYMPRIPDNIDELKQKAAGAINQLSDEELRNNFASTSVEDMVTNTSELALARAALDRLSKMPPTDEVSVQMVKNILDAMEKYVSKSGSALRFIQEDFDAMPIPMKVKYIVKNIDSANKETPNYIPLSQDRARSELVEGQITARLNAGKAIADDAAVTESRLTAAADAARNGQQTTEDIPALVKELRTQKRNLEANNGELVKYYETLIPKRSGAKRVLSDYPRFAMLASFTGRINDVLTTTANVAHMGLENVTGGLLAKAVNLVRPGKATDTLRGVKQFGEGTIEGVRRGGAEFGGTRYVSDLQGALDNTKRLAKSLESRSGLQKAQGPVGRTIQAATEFATQATQGVRDQRLYQLAVKEGQQLGVEPGLIDQYARARSAVPSRQMVDAAEQLRLQANNLNANPITHTLNRVSAAIEGKSAIGGLLKNQVIPFTSWLGGNIWNSITDKNVVANAIKIGGSALKGDVDGIVRNLAKFGNNLAYTYALGYVLTEAGLITNQDANGYSDAGAYLHVGDRYIPVWQLGFFAPSIVLGNATYNGINSDGTDGQGAVETTIDNAVTNIFKGVSLQDAVGADNNISRAIDTFKNSDSALDAGAQFAASAAGQFIPGVAGDANAILNMTSLNPTGEAANTKVVDPNSPSGQAKDVPKTAVNQFLNRLPVYSQLGFPRKEGVAASDIVDRITRGTHDTEIGKANKAEVKSVADRTKDFKARGIPDPAAKSGFDDAVEARIQEGNFDAAIEGLQAKIADNEKNKDIPKSKSDDIRRHITELEVTRDGKFDPKVIDLYKKTNLTEWRDMGDPESDNYDKATYDLLWAYDSALANKGVSRNGTKADKNFYSVKEKKSGSGGGSKSRASTNTIGSVPTLSKIDFGSLRPEKAGSKPIPIIRQPRSSELVKKRKISVARK